MASYDIGGQRVVGGHATGRREASGWVSFGDTDLWSGNILEHVYECFNDGAYIGTSAQVEQPTTLKPILQVQDDIYLGYYMDMYTGYDDPVVRAVVFTLSTDGTPSTIYRRTSFTVPLDMAENAPLDWMYPYIETNNTLSVGWGMSYTNIGKVTEGEANKINSEGGGANLSPVVQITIVDSDGVSITEEDLELAPENSTPDGGGGSWDNDSDTIPFPDLPVLGAVNSGFLTVYNPTVTEIQRIGQFLWSDASSVWHNIMNYQTNVLDLIVSLSVVPLNPTTLDPVEVKIGGVSTGITSAPVLNQYVVLDCGTFNVREYYGNALDYGQYTRIFCQLPFIGARELKTDEVMDGSISIRYNIDLVTGACVALIRCNRHGLDAVLYQFEGNLSMQIPIVSRDFMGMYQGILTAGIGMAGGAISGGAGGAISSGLSSAMNVMSLKPQVHHSGNLSANGGFLGVHVPYLIIERPIQSVPSQSQSYYGAPSNIRAKLGDLKGYTECEAPIIDIDCTSEERELIKTYLEEGIIL